ncbi:MAG: biotin--[acetyl-CoA-carboxylase] ligase [Candidatus Zixiibacteriota bacterium]|nr:MAG: biotin--[acetyl-CoA-carboxylase] ligase [candidate division Zixibacteria bacterium]
MPAPDILLEKLADDVLLRIRKRPEQPVSIATLAHRFGASDDAVRAAADLLISYGYRLKRKRDTLTYHSAPDCLLAAEITYGLKTKWLGHHIAAYNMVKSTNDIAAQMAEEGTPHGTIVTAEQQTKGRGRLGRDWFSPPGTGIYVSMVLRPKFRPDRAPALSIVTAVALADSVSNYCPGQVKIKWPNDLLLSGKKTSGILTELSAEGRHINHVVIGVGINVNQGSGSFPEEIRHLATSLRRVARHKINRVELLQLFLGHMEKEYERYLKKGLSGHAPKVRRYSSLLGYTVSVRSGKNVITGQAVDIDDHGHLILEVDQRRLALSAGEVTVVKSARPA